MAPPSIHQSMSSLSSSLESKLCHEMSYVSVDLFCHWAIRWAVANANSLQRENIIVARPFVPENELMRPSLFVILMLRSSSRISSDATDTDMGSIIWRAGSISARHMGHLLSVFNDLSKHDMQYLCPHAVMATLVVTSPLVVPGTSKHTAHTSGLGAARAFHKYCIYVLFVGVICCYMVYTL
jgi:hypothetical protein